MSGLQGGDSGTLAELIAYRRSGIDDALVYLLDPDDVRYARHVLDVDNHVWYDHGVAILWAKERSVSSAVQWVALAACCNVAAMHFSLQDKYFNTCRIDQISHRLSEIEKAGRPIAHQGVYAGQYHFPGRLTKPFVVLDTIDELRAWQEKHPDGSIVGYEWEGKPLTWPTITDVQPFRRGIQDHRVGIVPGTLTPR